jgi:hypothetical protein
VTLSQLQIITATDGAGTNCQDRAQSALALFPQLRAVIGSLLIRGCRDQRTGQPIPWAKPWGHHIWLIEPDGASYDPSACNLKHWAQGQEVELPRPWREMTAGVLESSREQARIVQQILAGFPVPGALPDAIYLPGLVYSSNLEELPTRPAYVSAWGRLARESVASGGWDAQQLEEALSRVPALMAAPSQIASIPLHRQRQSGRGRGFAQGVR